MRLGARVNRRIAAAQPPLAVVWGLGFNGLGVVRSLGRHGISVIGLESSLHEPGNFSKYCLRLSAPHVERVDEMVEYLTYLGSYIRRVSGVRPILFASGDPQVALISQNHCTLAEDFVLTVPDYSVVRYLLDKRAFSQVLQEVGLPGPRTCVPVTTEDAVAFSHSAKYPSIVKPVFSGPFNIQFGKVIRAGNATELMEAYERARMAGHEVILQEMICGPDSNLHLVAAAYHRDSRLLGAFTFRRIRQYPREFGNGALCVSDYTPQLVDLCSRLIAHIGYYGIIDAEFKYDDADGTFKFIEINPRTGWQNSLATACGVNLPLLVYRGSTASDTVCRYQQRDGVRWLLFSHDLRSAIEERRSSGLTLRRYLRSLGAERVYAVFAWDDWLPFVRVLMGSLRRRLNYVWNTVVHRLRGGRDPGRR